MRVVAVSAYICTTAAVDIPKKEIAPGVMMPVVNMGTWTADGSATKENATQIVSAWLGQGGRGVDTALVYADQGKVADAIAASGIDRKDIFITTKIPGCGAAQASVNADLNQLKTDYIDLLLI